MHWYGGSIAEAVTLSKQKNAIFVVFVEGENDLSVEMASILDDSGILKRLSDEGNFLAIKLKSGSTNYMHFAKIYQFVPVPSLFFIGRNGTPLEVVCAGVQAENLAARIDRILEEHHKDLNLSQGAQILPSTSAANVKQQTANLLQSEAMSSVKETEQPKETETSEPETSGPPPKIQKTELHEVTRSGQEYDVVCDGDVCVRVPKKPDEAGPSTSTRNTVVATATTVAHPTGLVAPAVSEASSTASMDEKSEKAKELIEAIKKEKIQKEKELEKQKELERRAVGQGVAELKRWQGDQELKQIQEERKRERLENELTRQRILQQIAQDRAERRARDLPSPSPAPAQVAPPTSGDGGGRARVQFKLPDGSSHTQHFSADDTLADLRRYVADNLQMAASSFSLWLAFPRRELTETDATLRHLELAPSAALLVLPRRVPTVVATPSTLSTFITFFSHIFTSFILEPTQSFFTWIRERLFPPSEPPREPTPSRNTRTRDPTPPGIRRRGNIHRLPGDRPSDDENNTWNGNSTQQM